MRNANAFLSEVSIKLTCVVVYKRTDYINRDECMHKGRLVQVLTQMAFHSLEVKWQAKIKRISMMMGNSEIGTGEEMLLTQTLMEIRQQREQ